MESLKGKVALVTGASRGAGRGIAIELGRAGATVYVTGRSTQGCSTNNWPGSIDETAAEINACGGIGIPLRCDHKVDSDVEAVVQRISEEHGKLDILVNNVFGGSEFMADSGPAWERSLTNWETMFTGGVRAQIVTNHYAIPLVRASQNGMIFHTTFWDDNRYTGFFYYDLAKNAINRMVHNLAIELKDDRIPVIAVSPGWMRTEIVLQYYNTTEEHWQEVEEIKHTETPFYVGRAVCAMATDPYLIKKTGQVFKVGNLAAEYGFTDIDGRKVPAFVMEHD